jgi:DHA2 family multidrug resistance protein
VNASDLGNRRVVTVGAMLATAMQSLDSTIANVALPHMQGAMATTLDQVTWVLTSYIVASAILTAPSGWLAARFGIRRVFLVSVAGFTLASVLCGLAETLPQMVLFRVIQGACGAALAPLSQAALLDVYPREQHGSAMAIWGLGVTVAPILGPTLGGWLTDNYNWRWVFYINVPLGVLAYMLLASELPKRHRRAERPFDWTGFIILSVAVAAFQLMLDRGQQKDWFGSTEIVVEAVLAGLFFYFLVVHTATTRRRPFIDPILLRDRNFMAACVLIFVVGVVLFATLALLPPLMQDLLGYPVVLSGLLLAPRGLGSMVAMMIIGRIINRVDARVLVGCGFLIAAIAQWQMAGFSLSVGPRDILVSGIVQGIGVGLIWVPLTTLAFATLPPTMRADAAGLLSLIRNIGSSAGISVVGALLARNTQINHAQIGEHITGFNLHQLPGMLMNNPALLNAEVTRQANMIGYLNDFHLMMIASLIAAPFVLLLRRPAFSSGGGEAAMLAD